MAYWVKAVHFHKHTLVFLNKRHVANLRRESCNELTNLINNALEILSELFSSSKCPMLYASSAVEKLREKRNMQFTKI